MKIQPGAIPLWARSLVFKHHWKRECVLGLYAGQSNSTAHDNTFIGWYTGRGHKTGNRNTFLGGNAGGNNVSGTGNVFLGHSAGYNESGSNKLYIDNSNTSSPLIFGDFSSNDVKINGDLVVTGNFTNPSDERLKKNIQTLQNPLNRLKQLRGVRYNWKEPEKYSVGSQIGVIAQEVEKHYPELVQTDSKGFKSVDYTKLTAILIEGVKQQQKIIVQQNAEIEKIKNDTKNQKGELKSLTQRMNQVLKEISALKSSDKEKHPSR